MASGDTLQIFFPENNKFQGTNCATYDVRNGHSVLDFDKTTKEISIFKGIMPRNYAGTTGITVYIHYSADPIAGNVDWDVSLERIGDQQLDIDGDSFADVNSVDETTVPSTSGLVDIVTVAFTDGVDMDSILAGESFRLKIERDAANDTCDGDVNLHCLEIK